MNARRLAVATAAALALTAAPAAAFPPDGLISCVENTKWQTEYLLENGQIDRPSEPCKPLT